ncbi:MAG: DNA recombination protein RmuC [Candidatus Omnitrophica bacterium]|nr:DNA recombination protein RmuC [Candidatus Omnitrophota bacterium]
MPTWIIILLAVNTLFLVVLLTRELMHQKDLERVERLVREEMAGHRQESTGKLDAFSQQIFTLTQINEQKLEKIRDVVETRLQALQEDNSRKLEKMRETVDEKLHSTLEKRLGESFKIVSERLEKVHEGLGEMQSLATGVGDLKKVLTNVKTRGTWGEIQLGNLLEQVLTQEQYERNVVTKQGSREPVEFAIKLPGRDGKVVYIPIDAKFPKEDYDRLLEAQDKSDAAAIEESVKAIENRIKLEAKKIRDKYIDPPQTTDFAIMYLPIEGLYAEVLRRPGLHEQLQRDFRVSIAGPTTITAHLNALQMGFRTLAVEKRASEVWQLLGAVRNEFIKFGDILDKTQTRLKQASEEIESAARKSRTIERKLKDVQELPVSPAGGPAAHKSPEDSAGDTSGKPNFLEDRSEDASRQPVDDDTLFA